MSRRTEKLASVIRGIVADEIQNRLADPRIATLTSVTRVEVTEDLSLARVFVSVMGTDAQARLSLRALQHARGHIHTALAGAMRVRQVPRIEFVLDESLKRGFEVVQLIDKEMAELNARAAAAAQRLDPGKDAQESE